MNILDFNYGFFYIELIAMNLFYNLSITEMIPSVAKMHKKHGCYKNCKNIYMILSHLTLQSVFIHWTARSVSNSRLYV